MAKKPSMSSKPQSVLKDEAMRERTTVGVSQDIVRNSFKSATNGARNGFGAQGKAYAPFRSTAFLRQSILDIGLNEDYLLRCYGIDVGGSYKKMLESFKTFCKVVGLEFGFAPQPFFTKTQTLMSAVDYFCNLIKPLGLELSVSRKCAQGEDLGGLECCVYRYGKELENNVVVLYACPARYLTPKGAELYKRFMKFVSQSMHIPLGVNNSGALFYIETMVQVYDDEFLSNPSSDDEEYRDEAERMRTMLEAYRENGEFFSLLEEIHLLARQDVTTLQNDMEEYSRCCPENEAGLIECLMGGLDIVRDMDVEKFDFSPDDNGFPNDWGYDADSEWSSIVSFSSILYSQYDGMTDAVIGFLNDDVEAGANISGWNIHLRLSPVMDSRDITEFMRCKDLVWRFSSWLGSFYENTEKFDRYGKD